ncbi:chymotrypsin-2-like [Toxorhynchites rutilus septentrionalis]|uniref:chymotrypsin-2-like n=1 Tax=Toxorhynchites rutilus septentrionalis TaxID=329112 RepID=UPI00247953EA|nr:chymotrypsin-2-like [Toxorhynchites rutilus septentrionalis]
MFRIVLLVTLVSAVVVSGNTLPEESRQGNGRIVNGNSAFSREFPFMGSLRIAMNNRHICGVSILTMRWVITAAHCGWERDPVGLRVVVGSHTQNTGDHHRVGRIVSYPTYDPSSSRDNIAMIQTASHMIFIPVIRPIALTERNVLVAGGAMVFGWGWLSSTGGHANPLQWKVTDVISVDECRQRLSGLADGPNVTDRNICTMSPVGGGVCHGDEGGPLVFAGQLIGIIGRTVWCGGNRPDVYARVWSYREWISETLES